MKALAVFTAIFFITSCMNEGTTSYHTYHVAPCEISETSIICGEDSIDLEPMEQPVCEPETEIVIVEREVVVEVEVEVPEDATAEALPQPVNIEYHGIICNSIPVLALDGSRFVMHQGKLNKLTPGRWLTVWEQVRAPDVRGCYVKLKSNGKVKSRYLP